MKRLATAFVLVPLVVYLVLAGHPLLFLAAVSLVAAICYSEFVRIAGGHGIDLTGPLGYAAGLLLVIAPPVDAAWFALVAILGLLYALRGRDLTKALPQAAMFVFGAAYAFGPWRCAVLLRQIDPHWLLYALALTWIGDTAGYYVGSRTGRHKLAPRVSPGKSWEGAAASLVASVLFGVLYLGRFLPQTGLATALALTAVASVAGQIGDLCESAIKRGAGMKDSGSFLPGHGGLLDRVDASLFTVPAVYFWVARGVAGP